MADTQDTSCGRMSPVPSPQTAVKTSRQSSKRSAPSKGKAFLFLDLQRESGAALEVSWQTAFPWHGGCLTPNFGESPSEENASTLSQILQAGVPEKYYLSPKACLGILRRASVSGKELPELLKKALERQAASA